MTRRDADAGGAGATRPLGRAGRSGSERLGAASPEEERADTAPATPATTTSTSAELAPGAQVGRYQIVSRLGAGGMGVVLLAIDPTLGRKVALKLLHHDASEDAEVARRRLVREAQGTAQLSHDNVVTVHEVGTHEGRVYLAMEYVAGRTLGRWQQGKPWRELVAMYVRAGQGLLAAHDAGLVHRDFKPDNVLVGDDGRVRVTDFGLVAPAGGDGTDGAVAPDASTAMRRESLELAVSMTRTGSIMGTPRYMAPEQHLGLPVDARADQFAFCVALYEALYRQPPFASDSYPALVGAVLAGEVAPPPAGTGVPAALHALLLRGLARDHRARHPSMRELCAALSAIAARPPRRPARTLALALGGIAGVAALAAVALGLRSRTPTRVAAVATDAAPATQADAAPAPAIDAAATAPAPDAAAPADDLAATIAILEDAAATVEQRREAVAALAASADERAAVALLRAAKRDPDAAIRKAARASVESYLDLIASLGPRPATGGAPRPPGPRGGGVRDGRTDRDDLDVGPDDSLGGGAHARPAPAPPPAVDAPPWARGVGADRQARAMAAFQQANDALRGGAVDDAIAGYRRALAAWDHPAIHYNLAQALVASGARAAAAVELRAALRYPGALGSSRAATARDLLARLAP